MHVTREMFFKLLIERLSSSFLIQCLASNTILLHDLRINYLDKLFKASIGTGVNLVDIEYDEVADFLENFEIHEFKLKLDQFLSGIHVLRSSRKNGQVTKDNPQRIEFLNFLQAAWFHLGKVGIGKIDNNNKIY
jgi:hypothetical protein